jgi:hypothetical protein
VALELAIDDPAEHFDAGGEEGGSGKSGRRVISNQWAVIRGRGRGRGGGRGRGRGGGRGRGRGGVGGVPVLR